MSDETKKRESQRALDASREAERQRLVDASKGRAQEALGSLLNDFLEEDTAVRNAKDLLSDEQREVLEARLRALPAPATPTPITKPTVTRPSPDQLSASRHEPSFRPHETIPSPPPGPPSESDKILVVDDDQDIRSVLSETLREEGYVIVCAVDGIDALKQLFRMKRCDLILLDISLPRMSGIELAETLLDSPWAHVPIILISAAKPELVEDHEHYVFLQKPLRLDSVLATIRDRIREAHETWGKGVQT